MHYFHYFYVGFGMKHERDFQSLIYLVDQIGLQSFSNLFLEDIVLNHPVMLRQRHHKQLGQIEAIHGAANHSRWEHCTSTMITTVQAATILQRKGCLPGPFMTIVYDGGTHDDGTGPFSHAWEYISMHLPGGMNHKQRSVQLLESTDRDNQGRTYRQCFEEMNVDVNKLIAMRNEERVAGEAGRIVRNKWGGTDKLTYTLTDSIRMNFRVRPVHLNALLPDLTFKDGDLAVDLDSAFHHPGSIINTFLDQQTNYVTMYTDGYLTPLSLAYERHIQRAMDLAVRVDVLDPAKVWDMKDSAVIDAIENACGSDERIQQAQEALLGYTERHPYTPVVALKKGRYLLDTIAGEKAYQVDQDFISSFLRTFSNPMLLTDLEDKISADLGMPVLVSVLPDPEKVVPGTIKLYRRGSYQATVEDLHPGHYQALRERADQHFAIRVLVPQQKLPHAREQTEKIYDVLREHARSFFNGAQKH